jgi:hypothetical protein
MPEPPHAVAKKSREKQGPTTSDPMNASQLARSHFERTLVKDEAVVPVMPTARNNQFNDFHSFSTFLLSSARLCPAARGGLSDRLVAAAGEPAMVIV